MAIITGTPDDDELIGTPGDDQIDGLAGNDTIVAGAGHDVAEGGDGHDILYGQQGNDGLSGSDGNDFFRGGTGDDLIAGGAGFDRVSHFGTGSDVITSGVTVSLLLQGAPQDTGQGWDTLTGIESLSGTPFDDVLTGDHDGNWLLNAGGAGNDSFFGMGGHDLLEVGSGDHWLDGGAGFDAVSFAAAGTATSGVNANLFVQGVAQNTTQGMMTLVGIENLSGTPFADVLTGNDGINFLAGDGGNDALVGAGGADHLFGDGAIMADVPAGAQSGPPALFADLGGAGNDTLDAGDGDDLLFGGGGDDGLQGGHGDDQIDGGPGNDTAGWVTAVAGVVVDLAAGFATGGDGSDTIVSVENALGSVFDDQLFAHPDGSRLYGQGGADELFGAAGPDRLDGGGGDDLLAGGAGFDELIGDLGLDTASYAQAAGAVDLDLGGGLADEYDSDGNYLSSDTLTGIENAEGSAFDDFLVGDDDPNQMRGLGGHDFVFGFGGDDQLEGNDGQDFLRGYDGNDQLLAGDGDDLLRGGNGDDLIDGAAGFDRASFFGTPGEALPATGVTVSLLLQGVPQDTGHGWDILVGIEALNGTLHDDQLTGDHAANWLLVLDGNDTASALGGDDLVQVANGNHVADGGLGVDTVGFAPGFATAGVTVSLALQGSAQVTGVGTMTLSGFENLSGTAFDDSLTGNAGANLVAGDEGSDTLAGGDGDDILFGDGAVDIAFVPGFGTSGPITIFADRGFGNDILLGGKGADVLLGGGGDDVLTGDQGEDRFQFGPGSGHDLITDFDKTGVIAILGVAGVDDWSDLDIVDAGKDTIISWDGGAASVTLDKFKASKLGADNFDFGAPEPAAAMLASAPGHAGGELWATVDHV